MVWTKRIDFTMWPVGQGLFTQADIWVSTEFLRVIYDCGTFCPSRTATQASFEAVQKRRVDLLVISHFHWDHISRIPELLNRAGHIEKVWIPYLAPKQRLLFAISTALGGLLTGYPTEELTEVVSLAAGARQWFESRGTIVREVGRPPGEEGSEEYPGPPSVNEPENIDDNAADSDPPEGLRICQLRRLHDGFCKGADFLAYGALVEANSGTSWNAEIELLTWIMPISEDEEDRMMRELNECFDDIGGSLTFTNLLTSDGKRVNTVALLEFVRALGDKLNRKQLRSIYSRLSGDLNVSSLFLMSRPIQSGATYRAHFQRQPWGYFGSEQLPAGPGILWTGDAPKLVLQRFLDVANDGLTNAIETAYIHQFPHHGSSSSILPQWLNRIGDHWNTPYPMSVISAGKSNQFKHPSPEALWRCPSIAVSEGSPPFEASLEWR